LLVEGVVIAGSILGAFTLDAWWQERQQRALRLELLADLRIKEQPSAALVLANKGGESRVVEPCPVQSSARAPWVRPDLTRNACAFRTLGDVLSTSPA